MTNYLNFLWEMFLSRNETSKNLHPHTLQWWPITHSPCELWLYSGLLSLRNSQGLVHTDREFVLTQKKKSEIKFNEKK